MAKFGSSWGLFLYFKISKKTDEKKAKLSKFWGTGWGSEIGGTRVPDWNKLIELGRCFV